MLFHIELWSREARRRQRPDVVGLLEDQRTQAIFASHRACEDLDVLRRSETPLGDVLSGRGSPLGELGGALSLFLQKPPGSTF
jgi:hypothetical protein